MTRVWVMLVPAAAGFFVLFSPWTHEAIAFWPMMCLTAGVLAGGCLAMDWGHIKPLFRPEGSDVVIGGVSGFLLYLIFWVGHCLASEILPFASDQVNAIYTIREGTDTRLIGLLLVVLIGPAEEIFWRGFVLRRLCGRYGLLCGFVLGTAVYAGVHIGSFNLMLIAAAAIGGAFWGVLFMATERLWPCIISHALWDVIIFVLWPIR